VRFPLEIASQDIKNDVSGSSINLNIVEKMVQTGASHGEAIAHIMENGTGD